MEVLFENGAEIAFVFKPQQLCDFINFGVRVFEHVLCFIKALGFDIIPKSLSGIFFKLTAEHIFVDIEPLLD